MARLNQERLNDENSFLAMSKDWEKITEKILEDDKLLKLIYYRSSDALSRANLTEEQKIGLINKNILCYPYIPTNDDTNNYIQILFDNFVPNENNPQYVDNTIIITVLCNKENWILDDWKLRLYTMANEITNLISNKKLTGIGKAQFIGAVSFVPSSEYFGLTMNFIVVNSINTQD